MKAIPYDNNPAVSPELNPATPEYIPSVASLENRNRYNGNWSIDSNGSVSPRTSPYSSPLSSPRANGPYVSPTLSPTSPGRVDYQGYSNQLHYSNQSPPPSQFYGSQDYRMQNGSFTLNSPTQQLQWPANSNQQVYRSQMKPTNTTGFRGNRESSMYGSSAMSVGRKGYGHEMNASSRAAEKKKSLQPSSFFHYGNIFLEKDV
mmetsp:Transcript_6095/g.7009  ORF Transcript_6095/g.7009 Transcript_6095/m.7009 type:complete len:203 (+) Transcript_6095:260-868(+)|eukprot:CAMPEP_0184006854 /NCGR_PEP_ID=MMETSP0954-20121128/957_1 /TAXON_ID=627963 /ORGANISM="Aplanochytrium sp, Strain PBS07" /LENGTH=202 /DNA_ID=CAMNT_0026285515 /DNA_START=472 /DNA_END=1080 /DNA_ORIENTATION=+